MDKAQSNSEILYKMLDQDDPEYQPLQRRVIISVMDMLQSKGIYSQRVIQRAADVLCCERSLEELRSMESDGLTEEDHREMENWIEQYIDEEKAWGLPNPSL